jgi:hypothetical protein
MVHVLSCMCVVVMVQVPSPLAGEEATAALRKERQALRASENAQLSAMADKLTALGQADAAKEVRARIEPEPPRNGPSRFRPLPDIVKGGGQGLANVPAVGAKERPELAAIRDRTAKALFDLAGRAMAEKLFALADDCLRGVLDRQPDHAGARRLLGFVPHDGGWATPYAVQKLKKGQVKHSVYGWVEADWVDHLERDELPAPATGQKTRWLPSAQADALRLEWKPPWEILTEHFHILTNVPMSEAIAFGRQLESFHDLFFALMADVIGPERLPLAQRYRNAVKGNAPTPQHRVFYFATKDRYVEYLLNRQGPGIADSLGIYLTPKDAKKWRDRPTSYFFKDEGGQLDITATLYHEVSHQLLFESAGESKYERNAGNYWVFEGLGTYFETLTPQPDGSLLVGGLIGPRIGQARLRLIDQAQFIPLEPFVALGKPQFDGTLGGGDVFLHYAEAMALAVFFMQYDAGIYRDAFLDYAGYAYRGQLVRARSVHALDAQLGVSYEKLNEQFRKYLKEGAKAP